MVDCRSCRIAIFCALGSLFLSADLFAQSYTRTVDPGWAWIRGDRVMHGRVVVSATEVTVFESDHSLPNGDAQSEVHLPVSRILGVASSAEAMYRHVRSKRQLTEPRDYFEFALWCQSNHLSEVTNLVSSEANIVFAKGASWAPWQRKLDSLTRQATDHSPIQLASFESPQLSTGLEKIESADGSPAASDSFDPSSSDLFQEFARSIQPILLGRCKHCHDAADAMSPPGWSLHFDRQISTNAESTRKNFLATRLRCIQERDGKTKGVTLVQMATTAHGDMRRPPLDQRHHGAIEMLNQWTAKAGQPESLSQTKLTRLQQLPTLRRVPKHQASSDSKANASLRLPPISNPIDPAIFNRQTAAMRRFSDREPSPVDR